MAVFSLLGGLGGRRSKMSVRSALARINEVLDEVLVEQEGDFDATPGSPLWVPPVRFDTGPYGDADNIARARNASIDHLDHAGS